jgi:hypothetical protein
MAIRKRKSSDTNKLVDGCGTILKNNRLKGGYKLVKRKRKVGETASTTTAQPKKRRGRPAKAKVTAPAMVSAPAKRRGRPAKAKVTAPAMVSAPAKRRGGKKVSATAQVMKPSVKATAKRRGRRVSAKA